MRKFGLGTNQGCSPADKTGINPKDKMVWGGMRSVGILWDGEEEEIRIGNRSGMQPWGENRDDPKENETVRTQKKERGDHQDGEDEEIRIANRPEMQPWSENRDNPKGNEMERARKEERGDLQDAENEAQTL